MILSETFEEGKEKVFKSKIPDNYKLDRNNLDSKMGVFTLNLIALPIWL